MADESITIPHYKQTIQLKPSAELPPDEYLITQPKYFYVYILYDDKFEEIAIKMQETFTGCKFTVGMQRIKNRESIETSIESLKDTVIKARKANRRGVMIIILGKTEKNKTGCFIVGEKKEEISFNSVWDSFFNMEELNRKPKLFLFQTYFEEPQVKQLGIQFDIAEPRRLYNVAAPGADMLIVSRVISDAKLDTDKFLFNICDYIKTDANSTDLVEMIMYATQLSRPLIVSTLTARFFVKSLGKDNKFRDINCAIYQQLNQIEEKIQESMVLK